MRLGVVLALLAAAGTPVAAAAGLDLAVPDTWSAEAAAWPAAIAERAHMAPAFVYADVADQSAVARPNGTVDVTVRTAGGAESRATFRVAGIDYDGAHLVARDGSVPVAVLARDGLDVALVGGPGGLAAGDDEGVLAFAAKLGLPDGEWARRDGSRIDLMWAGERVLLALDCHNCTIVARGDITKRFDAAEAFVHEGRLVAFRTTPWLDPGNSTLLLQSELRRALDDHLAELGHATSDATVESTRLRLVGGEPRLVRTWLVELAHNATPQPWTHLRVDQDASTGDLVGIPYDLTLDPERLASPTPTTPRPPPVGRPGETTPIPSPGAPLALLALGALALARRPPPTRP